MLKYVLKRIGLMLFTFFIIVTICFFIIRLLPREMPTDQNLAAVIASRWEALGYDEPIIVQYGIYLNNPERLYYKGIQNLYDPNGVHQICDEYFKECPINLERM